MEFSEFAGLCQKLQQTKSRLKLISCLCDFLKNLSPSEARISTYLLLGRPFPPNSELRLDLSWAGILTVINTLGIKKENIKAVDAGEFAAKLLEEKAIRPPALTLSDVYRYLEAIALSTGKGSRGKKQSYLKELFERASPIEVKYIVNSILGDMRIGVDEGILLEALARLSSLELEAVRRAYMFLPDLGEIASRVISEGKEGILNVKPKLFYPLRPMLAQGIDDIKELSEDISRFSLEFKYDGLRVQIHKRKGEVRLFSRKMRDISLAFPELLQKVSSEIRADSAILDGEIIAVDKRGRLLPFQYLSRRIMRKEKIKEVARDIMAKLFLFDCLYMDGGVLVDLPYRERIKRLSEIRGGLSLAQRTVPKGIEDATSFFKKALEMGHEGLVAKALDGPYTPGVRGRFWFKIKKAITVDLLIVAAQWGYGRRHNFLSDYWLACFDEENRKFVPVGKTFKGLTDKEFTEITKRLLKDKVAEEAGVVYVRPSIVVEVAFNEIQRSKTYSSGFALRFARIKRIRDDKSPFDITTLSEIREIYKRQLEKR